MVNYLLIVGVVVVLFVIIIIGGGVAYFIYIGSRPKKMTWNAEVYQVGDGKINFSKKLREKGKIWYTLSELKPYLKDIIEKIDKKSGATHYWLQTLKKPTPAVTADCVDVWSQKDKRVKVLLEEDSCTLLKSGYDRKLGTMIFRPLPHDRINMIKTELSERQARIENTKDILSAITPFITIAVSLLALVAIVYFEAQSAVKIGELNSESTSIMVSAQENIAKMFIEAGIIKEPIDDREIKDEQPPEIPP